MHTARLLTVSGGALVQSGGQEAEPHLTSDKYWEETDPPPPPAVNRMSHACENITFPQLRFRAVKSFVTRIENTVTVTATRMHYSRMRTDRCSSHLGLERWYLPHPPNLTTILLL